MKEPFVRSDLNFQSDNATGWMMMQGLYPSLTHKVVEYVVRIVRSFFVAQHNRGRKRRTKRRKFPRRTCYCRRFLCVSFNPTIMDADGRSCDERAAHVVYGV